MLLENQTSNGYNGIIISPIGSAHGAVSVRCKENDEENRGVLACGLNYFEICELYFLLDSLSAFLNGIPLLHLRLRMLKRILFISGGLILRQSQRGMKSPNLHLGRSRPPSYESSWGRPPHNSYQSSPCRGIVCRSSNRTANSCPERENCKKAHPLNVFLECWTFCLLHLIYFYMDNFFLEIILLKIIKRILDCVASTTRVLRSYLLPILHLNFQLT